MTPLGMLAIDTLVLSMVVAMVDYLLFYQSSRCDYCGHHTETWWSWFPATLLEMSCFVGGVVVGYVLAGWLF